MARRKDANQETATIDIVVNDTPFARECTGDMPLLGVLRDRLKLTGTKFGCGRACAARAPCISTGRPYARAFRRRAGRHVTTIEGLSPDGRHPLQLACAEDVPQCGYCQPGQLMRRPRC